MMRLDLAFARPWWLLALAPLAWLVWDIWRRPHVAASAWKQIVDTHLLPHLLTHPAGGETRIGLSMLAGGLMLAVLALAGPTGKESTPQVSGRQALRVIVIELSPASAPLLPRIREKASALLAALPPGETALLVYADEPYLVVPPTSDIGVLDRFLPELAADAMPVAGNRPDRAYAMAAALLARNADAPARDMIWIAAEAGEPVRTLAAHTDGRAWLLHAGQTNDPAMAQTLQRNGGALLRMEDGNGDIDRLAASLADCAGASGGGAFSARPETGYWLLLPLLPLAALAFRRGVLVLLVAPVLFAGLAVPPPAHAFGPQDFIASRLLAGGKTDAAASWFSDPAWSAIAHYRAGRYEEAARLLEDRKDPDSLYNRGNALAKQGRLLDALAAYEAALALRPADADTIHNRDLVRRLLNQQNRQGGKQNPPPASQSGRDAERVAEQWLRSVPDEPQSLLRRKLALEHRQRAAGKVEKPW